MLKKEKFGRKFMPTYRCEICNMGVNASCADCNVPLENGSITTDGGAVVQVSRCPNCEGKIKSPICCGQDMICST